MAVVSRLLPLAAFSTFAIFVLVLLATPANALNHEPIPVGLRQGHMRRQHDAAKHIKRCRPKSSPPAQSNNDPTPSGPTSTPPTNTPSKPKEPAKAPPAPKAPAPKPPTPSDVAKNPPAYSGNGGGGNNKKLLLGWPNGPKNLEKFKGSNVAGLYTWSAWCPENAEELGIPCSRMFWGVQKQNEFIAQIKAHGCNGQLVFGFNEPNLGDQANMSPQHAASLWKSIMLPLKDQGCKLVSPALTSAPDSMQWFKDMNQACGDNGCGWDFIALHWYGRNPHDLEAYVNNWAKAFGKPLIISEYACHDFTGGPQAPKDEVLNFHYTMGKFFDDHSGVAMYAPFGFMSDMNNVNPYNQLMSPDGGPNELGKWYLWH